MKLELGRLVAVGVSVILCLALAKTPSGQQTRTSSVGSAPPASAVAPFPVEETTIAQLHAAYLAGKTTAHEVTQA
jgi:ABC-type uncharacterized transport system permease subunit